MKARLVALALLLVACGPPAAAAGPDGARAQAADAAARRLRAFSGVVLVAHDGRVALLRGYGGAKADALFDIGSVAKTFTAAAVLRLAGLPQSFDRDLERVGRAAAVGRILRAPGPPAGRFAYSNAGYTLLAAIVERASEMPFRRFVRTWLLLPAGMRSTGWLDSPPPGLERARGHARGRSRGPAGSQVPLSWSILGAGGMVSTARDLFRWSLALRGDRVLSARDETDYGFTADFRRFVDERTTIVTLSDTDRAPAAAVAARIERADFGS